MHRQNLYLGTHKKNQPLLVLSQHFGYYFEYCLEKCPVARLSHSLSLSEVIGWENSRKHSGTNYTVYALRFMSLTRWVFVVCAHRIWGVLGKDLSLSCSHNSLLPCCKSSRGWGVSSIRGAKLKAFRTLCCWDSDDILQSIRCLKLCLEFLPPFFSIKKWESQLFYCKRLPEHTTELA